MSREERERLHDILEAIDAIRSHFRIERERIDEIVEQHLDPLGQAVEEFLAETDA